MTKSKASKRGEEVPRANHKSEHWIIVYNPWYLSHSARNSHLSEKDLQEIAWWLQFLFGPEKVQTIQHRTNHIISCRHDWVTFLRGATPYERREHSKIFEYDFVKNGDQSEKGWDQYTPIRGPPPHNFPVVQPHPAPVWCEGMNIGVKWALPIDPPAASSVNTQDIPCDTTMSQVDGHEEPGVRVPRSDRLSLSAELSIRKDAGAPIHAMDPRITLRTPLGAQPAEGSTIFRPYQKPSHHPLHPLTRSEHNAGSLKGPSPVILPKNEELVKREPSPIRVPYPVLVPEEEAKVKSDPSLIGVSYQESTLTCDEKQVKGEIHHAMISSKREDSALSFPEDDPMFTSAPVSLKPEPRADTEGMQWLAPNGETLATQLVLIWNPFGVRFPPPGDKSLPDVIEAWDWLQLVADGALALYFDWKGASSCDDNWMVARFHSHVDLKGVLGQHRWGQILESCPSGKEYNVSTIRPYLENPESQGLRCLHAPETEENYELFCVPYPAPLPLPNDSIFNVSMKRRRDIDAEDGRGQRVRAAFPS